MSTEKEVREEEKAGNEGGSSFGWAPFDFSRRKRRRKEKAGEKKEGGGQRKGESGE